MFVFTGGLVWGHPFIVNDSGSPLVQYQDQDQEQQEPAKSVTFTGTVARDGDQFVLQDASGEVYKLDDSARVGSFEGKTVKVTGRLEEDAKLIHVDSIEVVSS
jgi:uncharacterized protein YdeI (BOF family)